MSFFDTFKKKAENAIQSVEDKIDSVMNHQFAVATMAFCALIVAADGIIEQSEKKRVAQVISSTDKFKTADQGKLVDLFHEFCDKLTNDFELGKINCFDPIRKLKGKNNSDQIINIGLIVAKSGSDFGDIEKNIIKEVCNILELNSSQYI